MTRRFPAMLLSFSLALPCFAAMGVNLAQAQAVRPSDKEAWMTRLRDANQNVAAARRRSDEADRTYSEMRHRNRDRGEAKEKILAERQQAQAAFESAEHQMDALLEEARRSGVPPGWIREALEEPAAANSN